jgi:CheY-like chemotaxis protein
MSDKILIVDDSPANLESLADLLGTEYVVDMAGSAAAAVEKVQKESYKVLVMDVKMPEMDGIELYRKLRTYDAGFKVVFYSAYPGEYEKTRECSELGLYVRKGKVEDLEALIRAVDKLSGRSA